VQQIENPIEKLLKLHNNFLNCMPYWISVITFCEPPSLFYPHFPNYLCFCIFFLAVFKHHLNGPRKTWWPWVIHCIIELFNYGEETFSGFFSFCSADNDWGMNKSWHNYGKFCSLFQIFVKQIENSFLFFKIPYFNHFECTVNCNK